jgi:hypothetical protein
MRLSAKLKAMAACVNQTDLLLENRPECGFLDDDIDVLAEQTAAGLDRALLALHGCRRSGTLLRGGNLDTGADTAELGSEAGLLGGCGLRGGGGRLGRARGLHRTIILQLRQCREKITAWTDCHDLTIPPGGRNGPSTRADYAQESLKQVLTAGWVSGF